MSRTRYLILGATGGPGLGVFLTLALQGRKAVGIGRTPAHVDAVNAMLKSRRLPSRAVAINLKDHSRELDELIAASDVLVSATQPNFGTYCLSRPHALKRVVAVSSIRLYSRFFHPLIPLIDELRLAIEEGPVPGALVLTTMQAGGVGYNNLERLERLAQISPVIPLPRSAAGALVQPVHTDDVVYCLLYCLARTPDAKVTTIGGPEQMTYGELVRRVGSSLGRQVWTPSVPDAALRWGAKLLELVPGAPNITAAELQRSAEDKICDIGSMFENFRRRPRSLDFRPQQAYPDALEAAWRAAEKGMN